MCKYLERLNLNKACSVTLFWILFSTFLQLLFLNRLELTGSTTKKSAKIVTQAAIG